MAPADRRILIVSTVLFVAITALSSIVAPESVDTSHVPNSFSSGPHGTKAAFLLLADLGHDVRRMQRSPAELPVEPGGTLLILAEPRGPIPDSELRAIRRFLIDGGAVLATGQASAGIVPHWPAAERESGAARQRCDAVHPSHVTAGAPSISMAPRARFEEGAPPQLVLYECGERGPGVVIAMVGKGRFLWWSGPTPFTNAGIQDPGNLAHFLNAVGEAGTVRILWDEYFHGYDGTLGTYVGRTPVPWGAAQAMLILVVAILTFTRRSGPVIEPAPVSRHSPVEFVETVGGLYERADARTLAVFIAYHRFRALLARKGIPTRANAADVQQRLQGTTGRDTSGLDQTLRECESALRSRDVEEWRALQLVQRLHEYAQHFGLIRAAGA